MSDFIRLKKTCPVCGGERDDCRQSTITGFIHCRGHNVNSNWIAIKEDSLGFMMYVYYLEYERYKREKFDDWQLYLQNQKKKVSIKIKKKQELLAKYRASLSIDDRDRLFRIILNQLELKEDDRQQFYLRNFSDEEIEKGMYRSVSKWQKLTIPVNDGMPGVAIGGKSLVVHSEGILCPIFNPDGLIIGIQIRYHNAQRSGKYNWVAGAKNRKLRPTSHLQNGELPIGYYDGKIWSSTPLIPLPDGMKNPVIIAEGTSIKPFRISTRTGIITIGASGGCHHKSPEQLKTYLEYAKADGVIISPDAGSRTNKHVLSQYLQTKELLESWGYKVTIAWWGQDSKDVGDLDECAEEKLLAIEYLTWEEFDCVERTTTRHHYKERNLETKKEFGEPSTEEYNAFVKEQEQQQEIDELSEEFEAKRDLFQYLNGFIRKVGKKARKQLKASKSKIKGIYNKLKKKNILEWNPSIPIPKPSEVSSLPDIIKFKKGDRLPLIEALREAGWQYILDTSGTGTGKSYDSVFLENPDGNIWYADINHRNPSIPEILDIFEDLMPRHEGIIIDANGKFRLAKTEEEKENAIYPSNCFRASLFTQLAKKGYDPNAKTMGDQNPICGTCPAFKSFVKTSDGTSAPKCSASSGEGWGYKNMRQLILAHHKKITGFPSSFPEPLMDLANNAENTGLWDYSNDIIIWEEFNQLVSGIKIIQGLKNDISEWFDLVWDKLPHLYDKISPLRQTLIHIFNNPSEIPRHGYNHEALLEIFDKNKIDLALEEIEEIQSLQTVEDKVVIPDRVGYKEIEGVDKSAINLTNRFFAHEAILETHENFEKMPSNILPIFLKVLLGYEQGAIRLNKIGQKECSVTVTTGDRRIPSIAAAAKTNILLDATGNKQNVSAKYQVDLNKIVQIEQETPPLDNLEIIHVKMTGLGSNEYSDQALQRVKNAIDFIKQENGDKIPVLSLKKYKKDLSSDGHWFNESRGSNDYQGEETMIFVGTPNTNLGAVEDSYYTWFGTLDGFEEYYEELQKNEVVQGFGRQRVNRYSDRSFKIYYLATNLDLSWVKEKGIKLTSMEALELTLSAGDPSQISRYVILQAIMEMVKTGKVLEDIRQKDIAENIGKSENSVQKLCAKFGSSSSGESGWSLMKKELKFLLTRLPLLSNNIEPGGLLQLAQSNSLLAQWLNLDRTELVEEFTKFVHGMDFDTFKEICLDVPANTIVEKIKFLFAVIGMSFTDDLDLFGINLQDWEKIIFNSA